MSFKKIVVLAVLGVACAGASAASCSSPQRNVFEDDGAAAANVEAGDGNLLISDDAKVRNDCPAGQETRVTGKVYDPGGYNGLYNIQVFVPSGPLPDLKAGAQCVTCDSEVLNPVASALTNVKGEFELKGGKLLAGKNIPLVIQVGKWRRKFTLPEVKACETNVALRDRDIRLPKNGREGDMPQIAVTTGGCDALECLLAGIGIDPAEFEAGDDPGTEGHIHLFRGAGGGSKANGKATPAATTLWGSAKELLKYDIVALSCECDEHNETKAQIDTMRDFANNGGRVFGTHYHRTWIKNSRYAEWRDLFTWNEFGAGGAGVYPVNTSFPKGKALAEWLVEVRASNRVGDVKLTDVTTSTGGIPASSPAQSWIGAGTAIKYSSFNTPLAVATKDQCGRYVFSDVHSAGSGGGDFTSSSCRGLNEQQTALEFMFFDLSSCVQDDKQPPQPPK